MINTFVFFNNYTEMYILQARKLFLKGVENEQLGKLYEAIQFYKRAVQLVPDIEIRLYESIKQRNVVETSEREFYYLEVN